MSGNLRQHHPRYPSIVTVQPGFKRFPVCGMGRGGDLGISDATIRHSKGLVT